MRRAVCPGSFDPVTNGHLDIVAPRLAALRRGGRRGGHQRRKNRLFDADERIAMMRRACADLSNVSVEGFAGLVTTFCAERDVDAIVKGLRAASDFDYELQMAQMNSSLTGVETVFIPTSPERGFVSSVAGQGGRGLRWRRLVVRPGVRPRPAEGPAWPDAESARRGAETTPSRRKRHRKHAESAHDDSARWGRWFCALTWPDTIRGDLLWPEEEVNP